MKPSADKDFFKDKPLQVCIEYLEKLLASSEEKEDALPALNALIENLVETNRMFDIASIYIFLKSAAANNREIGFFYVHANRILKHHINDLFTKSITYNNTELRETFSDILGTDTGQLMELVSFIFRKYRLFEIGRAHV